MDVTEKQVGNYLKGFIPKLEGNIKFSIGSERDALFEPQEKLPSSKGNDNSLKPLDSIVLDF